jgi:hypothetical protein
MRRAVAPLLLALAIVSPLLGAVRRDVRGDDAVLTAVRVRRQLLGHRRRYIDGNGPTAVAYLGWLMGCRSREQGGKRGWQEPRVRRERAGTGEGAGRQVKEASSATG